LLNCESQYKHPWCSLEVSPTDPATHDRTDRPKQYCRLYERISEQNVIKVTRYIVREEDRTPA